MRLRKNRRGFSRMTADGKKATAGLIRVNPRQNLNLGDIE